MEVIIFLFISLPLTPFIVGSGRSGSVFISPPCYREWLSVARLYQKSPSLTPSAVSAILGQASAFLAGWVLDRGAGRSWRPSP